MELSPILSRSYSQIDHNISDPNKNIRKFALIGFFVGLIISALANKILIIGVNPEAGWNLAKVYIWLLPAVGGILFGIHIFKIKRVPPKIRGFFGGISVSAGIINVVVAGLIDPLNAWFQSIS